MKKYLLVPLILSIILAGCTEKNQTESKKALNKEEIFTEFVEEKDLDSYVLKCENEITFGENPEDKIESEGIIEMTEKPKVYHSKWKAIGDTKEEIEYYTLENSTYFKENDGEWQEMPSEKDEGRMEKNYFVGGEVIGIDMIFKPLKEYYKLTENEDTYIAKLSSDSENMEKIKNILYGEKNQKEFLGELSALETKFVFEKGDFNPKSFEWRAKFLSENDEILEIKQSGQYEKINELKNIEIPQELQTK